MRNRRARAATPQPSRGRLARTAHLALALLFLGHQSAWAAVIPVDGACTLVDAITAANDDSATGSCPAGSGADTLTLSADVTLTAVDNSVQGANGLPSITSDITIEGNGHSVARSSASEFRIFHLAGNGTLTADSLTVTGGVASGIGTAGYGGGFLNLGTATLTNSTVSGNSASTGGGGLANAYGVVTLTSSTVSGNSASNGGGFFNLGTMTLTNSTVSGNSSSIGGGGFNSAGSTTLTNSTVSGNSATATAGGLAIAVGSVTLANSIVGNSSGPSDNCFGPIIDSGNSLADDASCGTVPGTLTGLDPTLADNGGSTQTHALLAGSTAIDLAGSCGLTTDQRGALRDLLCDSGAFEVVAAGCANGLVEAGEQCDDGNSNNGDCCSATCQFAPGPGMPACCALGVCQIGQACGAVCFMAGGLCEQPGGPGTACNCALP